MRGWISATPAAAVAALLVAPGLAQDSRRAEASASAAQAERRHDFSAAIYLAYGVTTTHNPAAPSMATFPQAELVEAGGVIGPALSRR